MIIKFAIPLLYQKILCLKQLFLLHLKPRDHIYIDTYSHRHRYILTNGSTHMNRKKISTTVYITEDQNDKLKLLNKRTKVPVAEYIRQGIDMVLDKYKDQIPGQMSF